jgi:carboxyl-terminal processing protease
MVVLQDARSASASEIVAGALASLDRAVVIGRQSYGKGTVQKLYTIRSGPDRVRLKLTVAEYKLSGGKPVHGEGIAPDLLMRRVVFRGTGAWYPRVEEVGVPVVLEVDERDGWREGHKPDLDADPLMALAHELLLDSHGPTRMDVLAAIERMSSGLQLTAADRLSETFLHRGIDWQPTDDQPGILDASVSVQLLGEARSGEWVTVRAEVSNQGPAPLYQARVRLLSSDTRTPWHNATIPVGFVPPGESALGQVEVAISVNNPDRSDDVTIQLEADELDPVQLDPIAMSVTGVAAPPVVATARLVPHEDHHRLEIELENKGKLNLTGVHVRLGWQDDSGVELIDREAKLPVLAAGDTQRVDLELRLLDGAVSDTIPIGLRVWAERFQTVLHEPVQVPRSGDDVHIQAPIVDVEIPVRVSDELTTVSIRANDDQNISSTTIWWQGEKHAWLPGGKPSLNTELELPIEAGSNQLTVVVRDDEGYETRIRRYVWGDVPVKDGSVQSDSPAQ